MGEVVELGPHLRAAHEPAGKHQGQQHEADGGGQAQELVVDKGQHRGQRDQYTRNVEKTHVPLPPCVSGQVRGEVYR